MAQTEREFWHVDRRGNRRKVEIGVTPAHRPEESGTTAVPGDVPTIWVDGHEIWSPVFSKALVGGWLDQAIRDFIDAREKRKSRDVVAPASASGRVSSAPSMLDFEDASHK